MIARSSFISREERFGIVESTNDIVRRWLADGMREVAIAVADEQSAGRGRQGARWVAPAGAALLLSLGFRPGAYLAPDRLWRLAAIASLAMADAAEEVAGLREGTIRLKWPNDLVAEAPDGGFRKLAGVLGETHGLGADEASGVRAVIGIGLNAGWQPGDFPPELAGSMTSLAALSGGRPIDRDVLLGAFLARLEPRHEALRDGRFDVAGWHERQATTGRDISVEFSGGRVEVLRAVGVDGASGALLVQEEGIEGAAPAERALLTAEAVHVRLPSATDARRGAGV